MIAPLVKWAGGKRQLRSHLLSRLPDQWDTYFEPFIGGGALLVELANQGRLKRAVIGDKNPELVNLYRVVKNKPEALITELSDSRFCNDQPSFNRIRAEFNALIGSRDDAVRRAANLLYLNKHSYNGLWRVNRKGQYNVPFGKHARLSLPAPVTLQKFSRMLADVTILRDDFARIVRSARRGDLVYFDPPYHPVSKTANFTDYTTGGFPFEDQERLACLFGKLADKGIRVILSNSKAPEIEGLYEDFTIHTVEAKRFINCNGQKRTGACEIIVTSY